MRLRDFHRIEMRSDSKTGLFAVFALHDLTLGPALGGVRRWAYADESDALADVVRLARGMTAKNALAGIPFGGGKSVIAAPGAGKNGRASGPPAHPITAAELVKLGEWIEDLGGEYVAAADVGMGAQDLITAGRRTRHIAGVRGDSETGPRTAHGVFTAIEVVARRLGFADLAGVRVAVQGLGKVGMPLCKLLRDAGAVLAVADIDDARATLATERFAASAVAVERALVADVDIVAPCALGGAITSRVASEMRARAVAGAANNQLADHEAARLLKQRGVLYAPDYVVNAGGVISAGLDYLGSDGFADKVREIGPRLESIFDEAQRTGELESDVADALVRQRLEEAACAPPR